MNRSIYFDNCILKVKMISIIQLSEESECLVQNSNLTAATEEKHPYSTFTDCEEKCSSSSATCLGFTVMSGVGEVIS